MAKNKQTRKTRKTKKTNSKKTNPKKTNLKCIMSGCNGDLERFETGKKLGFDILYFKCPKCKDMTYYFHFGDTYDREIFTLANYQSFLKSVDVEILSLEQTKRRLNERERSLIYREQALERKGIRGLIRRFFPRK